MFCIDGTQVGSNGNVRKFEITGHNELTWYLKIGASSWTVQALTEDEIEWANSLSTSPTSSTQHWILEFQIPKNIKGHTIEFIKKRFESLLLNR